jgi:hypothetical protein
VSAGRAILAVKCLVTGAEGPLKVETGRVSMYRVGNETVGVSQPGTRGCRDGDKAKHHTL